MKRRTGNFEHYAKLVLRLFLSYIIFILVVSAIVLIMANNNPDKGTGDYKILFGILITSFIFVAPINTIVILLLYIFNINKFLLQNLWYVLIESLCYLFSIILLLGYAPIILEFLKKFIPDFYPFLAPYLIVVPIFALQGYYIKRKRKRKELAETVPAINPDDSPQSKQTDH